jgi:hypothetical protein
MIKFDVQPGEPLRHLSLYGDNRGLEDVAAFFNLVTRFGVKDLQSDSKGGVELIPPIPARRIENFGKMLVGVANKYHKTRVSTTPGRINNVIPFDNLA